MRRFLKVVSVALLALGASGAHAGVTALAPRPASVPALADVDLDDVPVGRALRLLAETYDVSIATGQLPDTRVTVRLRGISAREAFAAVATAAGLDLVEDGAVLRVLPKGAPEAVAAALATARQRQVVDRVFHLGVAPGEETLKAIQPLLEPHLETATYNATENLLTVSALPGTLERIESLLAELTKTPAQYEIEVRVVEVTKTALRQIGSQGSIGLDIRGGVLASTFPLSGLSSSHRYLPSPADLAALGRVGTGGSTGTTTETGSFADSGFRFGHIDARGIGLVIQLLEQTGEARVLATPKVTALDNRKARISMVTTLRIPTFTQNQAFATTTVTGIEQVDVGTTLEVRPRRGSGRQILLTVTPEVSELQPGTSVFNQSGLTQGLPIVTRRRTETEVILDSGETLVIGGLVTEHKTENHGKTPGLGDIPLLGRAFRLEARQSDETELLVFVTPHELPPPEERQAKVRVDDAWISADLAARVQGARALLHGVAPADRIAGIRALEPIDADLSAAGVDAGPDVAALGADASLPVEVEAALFLLHARPAEALSEIARFRDSRTVALSALAAPLAPHLRAALAETVVRSAGGAELLARQLDNALAGRDAAAARNLGEALVTAAPALAADRADRLASLAAPGDEAEAQALRLDALSGAPGHEAEIAAQAAQVASPEVRSFALAAFLRALGPRRTAELLAGGSPVPLEPALAERLRTLEAATAVPMSPEPALAWSGAPAEIAVTGSAGGTGTALVREALALLARRAPDLRNLVGFGLAKVETGGAGPAVDPAVRSGRVTTTAGMTAESVALQLVRLATLVFESRVRGFPAAGGRNLARAVREEIGALERLTGAPCPPERAAQAVRDVLAAASPGAGR